MITLPVDRNDGTWRVVAEALARRRADLLSEILDVGATDEARRNAVARYDELGLVLDAPADTLRSTQARHQADESRVRLY